MAPELAPIKVELNELVEKTARMPDIEEELAATNTMQSRLLRRINSLAAIHKRGNPSWGIGVSTIHILP